MSEKLSQSQINNATRSSKKLESAWRIYTRPNEYSFEEVQEAVDFIVSQSENFRTLEGLMESPVDVEVLEQVFMGLFHYPKFSFPVELKYRRDSN